MTSTQTAESSNSQWPAQETVSPFAEFAEVEWAPQPVGETDEVAQEAAAQWAAELQEAAVTPFANAALAEDREVLAAELMAELGGTGLGEALGELVQEWSGMHAEAAATGGLAVTPQSTAAAAALVERAQQEVAAQAEAVLDGLAGEFADRELGSLSEEELPALLAAMEAPAIPATASPAQEQFFKAIARAARRVVGGAVKLVKRGVRMVGKVVSGPLRLVLNRLKKLVRPLLRRVLTWAINRLPVALRPPAEALRRRLFGAEAEAEAWGQEAEESAEYLPAAEAAMEYGGWGSEQEFLAELRDETAWRGGVPAVGDTQALEAEFAATLAHTLSAEDEAEIAAWEAEFATSNAETEAGPDGQQLDAARIALIAELAELAPGASPAPAIERFLPAVLPILRIGVRIIGRQRVVRFLANLLAGLIRPLVGPQLAPPLSQAVVDAGLRIFGFEASPQDRELAGPSAVASVLEDTVQRLAEQGESVFEDTDRLHTETIAAFNEAVAHSVPGSLVRSDLADRETTGGGNAAWLLRPRVYWYRKYARTPEVTLTQQLADSIVTFGGVRLSAALRAQGVRLPVKAKVHLYETLPGTYLSRISALERHVPGMGADGWRRFHPLTTAAAGALLGEPGLGRDVDARFLADRSRIAAGQRVFYLQLAAGTAPAPVGQRRPSQAFVTLDGRPTENRIRLILYFSEADAQQIAARVRANNTTAFLLAARAAVRAAVTSLRSAPASRLRILRETAGQDEAAQAIGAAVVDKIISKIIDRLIDAAIRVAGDQLRVMGQQFVAAADKPADGVTLVLTYGAAGLSTLLRGGPVASVLQLGVLRTLLGTLATKGPGIEIRPGLHRY